MTDAIAIDNADKTYKDAVSQGHYDLYDGGLSGAHDNVRCYWEDQLRMAYLRPHLEKLKEQRGGKLRICDMGAGSGEGLRLLMSCNQSDADLLLHQAKVLPIAAIECYRGVDLSEAMVECGNVNFAEYDHVTFRVADFSDGFPLSDDDPYDLYYCSYGSYSHINSIEMKRLLSEIVAHAEDGAVIVGDWLGRHSIEWPCYWDQEEAEMLDYSMSYMPGAVGGSEEAEHFPLRYWTGKELRQIFREVGRRQQCKMKVLEIFDASLFVGRHVDTREYNDWVRPLRTAVNSLHEPNVRTDLESLRAEVVPMPDHEDLYGFFSGLAYSWNHLIEYCMRRLEERLHPVELEGWKQFPSELQMAMLALDRIIDSAYWMQMGDPRANIIEPQLGYALRSLEDNTQRGQGRGHGLVGIIRVHKT